MKANQVGAQQPVNEFTLPWANPEDFGVWPGDMPENRDAGVWANFLNHARNQCQVIVLRQENRRIHVRHFLQNSIGKPLVNPLVLQPVLGAKNRPGVRDVAERPKALVRKTIVVAQFLFSCEPQAFQKVFDQLCALRNRRLSIAGGREVALNTGGLLAEEIPQFADQ